MSIISRNIDALGNKFSENIKYVDLDYRGFLEDGSSATITGGTCVVNNLRLWLQSTKGDYYRRATMGGFFDDNLRRYPMTDTGAEAVEIDLQAAIEKEFPSIEVLSIKASPDVDARGWRLYLVVRDTLTGVITPVTTGIEVS